MLLHRFEQRGLGLGRRAVDFVRENEVGEHGPGDEHHPAGLAGVLQNLRAGDVRRHEVGRELDALELEVEDFGDGLDEERLGQPRRAGDEAVPAGEQGDEQLFDHLLLADNDLGEFSLDARAAGDDLFHRRLFICDLIGRVFHNLILYSGR